jgi:hypothetical protein
MLGVVSLWVGLVPAAALQLASVTPSSIPTVGGVPLVISLHGVGGRGGSDAAPQSDAVDEPGVRPLKCKLSPACSIGHFDSYEHQCSSVVHATFQSKDTARLFDAEALNSTHITCTPPAVTVAGPVHLSVGAGCTIGGGDCSNYLNLSYHALVDVVVGRRPYLNESRGVLRHGP